MTLLPPTSGAGRLLRGGVAGAATGALAVVAHVEANGALPGAGLVVLPVLLLAAAASALGGRERGPAQILALVGAGQFAMHLLMSLAAARAHDHGAQPFDSGPLMPVAHVLATLAVVAVLAGAERAVFAVTAALASVLPRKLGPVPVTGPLRTVVAESARSPVSGVARGGGPTRRGPPATR
ncbi:hypothetical protein [Umezawaea sp.]|uniref:hypothetical protein n=1 Tax=Umezawaea sp. TaxID=1955258 RepID=UPI002ED633B0